MPARDEVRRIADTVRAALSVPEVDLVVVCDDGSRDGTAQLAREAGAVVVRHRSPRGKAAAMVTGAEAVALLEQREGAPPRPLLFLDADLRASAAGAGALCRPVLDGSADMAVALLPRGVDETAGGHGLVVGLARRGILARTGIAPSQPLSGQRCLTRAAFDRARPLAPGYGVETALTLDLLRAGLRVVEVDVPFGHRVTGRDLPAQLHRGRQLVDVARALSVRALPPRLLLAERALRGVPLGCEA